MFIPPNNNMSFEEFHKYIEYLAKKYDQYAYVIGKDGGEDIRLYERIRDGGYKHTHTWNHVTFRSDYLMPDQFGNLYYSKIKGREFQFRNMGMRESTGKFGPTSGRVLHLRNGGFEDKFGYSLLWKEEMQ